MYVKQCHVVEFLEFSIFLRLQGHNFMTTAKSQNIQILTMQNPINLHINNVVKLKIGYISYVLSASTSNIKCLLEHILSI